MTPNFKKPKQAKDPAYLAAVRGLPCCVCERFGLVQTSQTTAHHTKCGRHSQAKTPDREAIPLCDCHHQGLRHDRDRSKIAFESEMKRWVAAYGEDEPVILMQPVKGLKA
jgi:hypothetical protein